jgi:mycothiol synthase
MEIRRFRSPDDFETLAAIHTASREADGIDRVRSADEFARSFGAFGIDAEKVGFVAEANGAGIGYVVGHADDESNDLGERRFHTGMVTPAWRRKGVGGELLRRIQARLLEVYPPTSGRASFTTMLRDTQIGAAALVERDGYRPVRYSFAMVRPDLENIGSVDLPSGIASRPVERDEAPRIFAAMDEAMRDEWSWSPLDAAKIAAAAGHPLFGQTDIWKVAWEGSEPVGGVLGWIDEVENEQQGRRRGYTEGIWVRRQWRGRGIAGALINRNLHELKRRGMTEAALSVDAANPSGALRLYETHGFRRARTETVHARPIAARGAS